MVSAKRRVVGFFFSKYLLVLILSTTDWPTFNVGRVITIFPPRLVSVDISSPPVISLCNEVNSEIPLNANL